MIDVNVYTSNSDFQKQASRNAIRNFGHLIQWTNGASIMDVGCGDGSTTAEILTPLIEKHLQKYTLLGCDVIDSMIAKAQESYKHIHFRQMDIATDNLDDNMVEGFHNIFSFFCFHLIGNYRGWIKNIYSMLKPGGQIFFLIATENPLCTEVVAQSKEGKWAKYMKSASVVAGTPFTQESNPKDWISNLLIEYQFKNVFCENIKELYVFRNTEALKAFIMSFKIIYRDIPKDILEDFLEKFTHLVGNRCRRVAGKPEYYFDYSLIQVVANK